MSTNPTNLSTTLETFLDSPDFKAGIISNIRGKAQQKRYLIELTSEGVYWVLEEGQITNISEESKHLFLQLPTIVDDELDLTRSWEETFDRIFAAKRTKLANQLRYEFRQTFLGY